MITLALITAALAASPVEQARAQLDQPTAPNIVLNCQPIGGLVNYLRKIPAVAQVAAKKRPAPEATDADAAKYLWSLFDPGGLEAAGFNPAGAVNISGWLDLRSKTHSETPSGMQAFLPFEGDRAQLTRLFESMQTSEFTMPEGETWETTGKAGKSTYIFKRTPDGLQVLGGALRLTDDTSGVRMIDGLPNADGCVLYSHFPDGIGPQQEDGSKHPLTGTTVFLPLANAAARIRILTTLETPDILREGADVPLLAKSTMRPIGVTVIAADPLEIARQIIAVLPDDFPKVKSLKEIDLSPDSLPFKVPAGTQLAVFKTPQGNVAAVIPVTTKKGKPVSARKLIKAAGKLLQHYKVPTEKHPSGGLVAKDPKGPRFLRVHATKGVLIVGTNDAVVEDIVASRGQAWISPKLKAQAAEFPVAFTMQMGPTDRIMSIVGLRIDKGMIDLSMGMQVDGEDATGAGVIGMLAAIAIPNFIEMQHRAKRAEAPGYVDGIKTALIAYDAAFDAYVAAPAHPRPVKELNGKQVDWPTGSAFDTLGWSPGDKLRGTYWVEVSPDGTDFAVYGAIDVDGDGVPAVFKATKSTNTTMMTPPKVY